MAEAAQAQAPDTLLVSEGTAVKLHGHLTEQGRNLGPPAEIHRKLGVIVDREWGTPRCPRFQDAAGGGWLIDMSEYLEGEMLYALIRTVHGRRTLTAIVDSDEYEAFAEKGEWVSPEAKSPDGVDPEVAATAAAIEQGVKPTAPGQPPAAAPAPATPAAAPVPQQNPDDPILILVKMPGRDDLGGQGPEHVYAEPIRCKRIEVPHQISMLLRKDGVTESSIEIWSCMSQPKVQVTF